MLRYLFIGFIAMLQWHGQDAFGQLVVNEVCSKNNDVLQDSQGDTPDWIELYNAGAETIDLEDYYLSDSPEEPKKWMFGDGEIDPGEFVIVFASEKEDVPGEYHANFKISAGGETLTLTEDDAGIVEQVIVPTMQTDHSYARQTDGSSVFRVFTTPTPSSTNTGTSYPGYAPDPILTEKQSFFIAPIKVAVTNINEGIDIRYTLDGSIPTLTSSVYSDTFKFDKTTTLRIRSFADGLLTSNTTTRSFFFNSHGELPVLSMTTSPGNLWDNDTGIYVFGPNADTAHPFLGANFWQPWERQIHLEMFLPGGTLAFSEDLAVRINGGSQARTRPARPFRLIAKQEFGASKIEFQVFPDKPITTFDRIILRNSGFDFNRAHLRDGLLHRILIEDGLKADMLAYRPVVLYLNGEYWGVYNMRERADENYVRTNHPEFAEADIDVLENDFRVLDGDSLPMLQFWEFLTSNDLSDPTNYEAAKQGMDIENIIDYFIAETYLNNLDWPNNNVKFWRPQTDSGKWHYFIVDMDVSLNSVGWVTPQSNGLQEVFDFADLGSKHGLVLKSLIQNDGFKHEFISRYADLMNTTFLPDRMVEELDEVVELIEDEMPSHFDRWVTGPDGIGGWYNELDKVEAFMVERLPYARQYVQEVFDLNGQVNIRLNVFPPEAGKIHINTITPETLPWEGVYYNGVPVTLTIEPNTGYQFSHWKSLHTVTQDQNETISYNFESDDAVTAFFSNGESHTEVSVYPNPSMDQATLRFVQREVGTTAINIFDQYGKQLYKMNTGTLNAGTQEVVLDNSVLNELANGIYWIEVSTPSSTEVAKLIRMGIR